MGIEVGWRGGWAMRGCECPLFSVKVNYVLWSKLFYVIFKYVVKIAELNRK